MSLRRDKWRSGSWMRNDNVNGARKWLEPSTRKRALPRVDQGKIGCLPMQAFSAFRQSRRPVGRRLPDDIRPGKPGRRLCMCHGREPKARLPRWPDSEKKVMVGPTNTKLSLARGILLSLPPTPWSQTFWNGQQNLAGCITMKRISTSVVRLHALCAFLAVGSFVWG